MSLAATSGVAVAGCSDDGGTGNSDNGNQDADSGGGGGPGFPSYGTPVYSDWPPDSPRTNDFVMFTHMNITHMQSAVSDEGTPTPTETGGEEGRFLIDLGVYGMTVTALWFQLGMWSYPWDGDLGTGDEPDGMNTESTTMTEGTFIFHGQYDPNTFADSYADGFEERGNEGFTVFEGQPDVGNDQLAYAVSEDAVVAVIAPDEVDGHDAAVGILDDALTNYVDEANRIADTDDGAWLYDTTGDGDSVMGVWQVDGLDRKDIAPSEDGENASNDGSGQESDSIGDSPVFENVESFIDMVVLPESEGGVGGDTAAARFAAIYPEGEVPDEDTLHEELAPSMDSEDLTITTTGTRAYVAAEVSGDEINAGE